MQSGKGFYIIIFLDWGKSWGTFAAKAYTVLLYLWQGWDPLKSSWSWSWMTVVNAEPKAWARSDRGRVSLCARSTDRPHPSSSDFKSYFLQTWIVPGSKDELWMRLLHWLRSALSRFPRVCKRLRPARGQAPFHLYYWLQALTIHESPTLCYAQHFNSAALKIIYAKIWMYVIETKFIFREKPLIFDWQEIGFVLLICLRTCAGKNCKSCKINRGVQIRGSPSPI